MAEMDQAPLIDLSNIKLADLIKEGDANSALHQSLRRAATRVLHDLQDPNGVISAFGSYAAM